MMSDEEKNKIPNKSKIVEDVINGYVAFGSQYANQLISEGKIPIFVVKDGESYSDFQTIEDKSAKKAVLFFDKELGNAHEYITLEALDDVHCVLADDLAELEIKDSNVISGNFSNGRHELKQGDALSINCKKYIYMLDNCAIISSNALHAKKHIQKALKEHSATAKDFDQQNRSKYHATQGMH